MDRMPKVSKDNHFGFLASAQHDMKTHCMEHFYESLADHNLELVAIIDHEMQILPTDAEKKAFLQGIMLLYCLIHRAHAAHELDQLYS